MLDQLRALAVFARVADAGSFRAAAKQLGISASVVSHHVTSLERYLDTPLIYRTTRKLSLTAAGKQLAVSAHSMLSAAEEGFGNIGQKSANPVGGLSITAPAVFQYARFVTRVSTFMKRYPKVEVTIKFSDRQYNIVEEGLDLAIRIGWLSDSSLMSRKLADGRLILCVSPLYEGMDKIRYPEDLARQEMIYITGTPSSVELTSRDQKATKRTERMQHRITVDSVFAAKRMAEEGCGVAMLPDFLVREAIASGDLVEILPDWWAPSFGIYAVWPNNPGTNSLRNLFVNYIAQIAKTEEETDRQMIA
jgi:DNA-binding transcriptional LysR family regulator